jgi:hypothetical protein
MCEYGVQNILIHASAFILAWKENPNGLTGIMSFQAGEAPSQKKAGNTGDMLKKASSPTTMPICFQVKYPRVLTQSYGDH